MSYVEMQSTIDEPEDFNRTINFGLSPKDRLAYVSAFPQSKHVSLLLHNGRNSEEDFGPVLRCGLRPSWESPRCDIDGVFNDVGSTAGHTRQVLARARVKRVNPLRSVRGSKELVFDEVLHLNSFICRILEVAQNLWEGVDGPQSGNGGSHFAMDERERKKVRTRGGQRVFK